MNKAIEVLKAMWSAVVNVIEHLDDNSFSHWFASLNVIDAVHLDNVAIIRFPNHQHVVDLDNASKLDANFVAFLDKRGKLRDITKGGDAPWIDVAELRSTLSKINGKAQEG